MLLDDNLKSKSIEWEWDNKRCGKGIQTFHENRAAFFHSSNFSAGQVLVSRPCCGEERFYFELEIIHTTRGAINVGVSNKYTDVEHRCGYDENGWSLSLFSGTFFHDRSWASQKDSSYFWAGTKIGMGIDMRKRTITFFFNGTNQGIGLVGFPSEIYPSVSLGDVGDCIAIVTNPSIPPF